MDEPRDGLKGLPRVEVHRLGPGMSVAELVEVYRRSGAYQAGRLQQACRLFCKMLSDPEATVALTLAGAMTPTGMGGALATLIERGLLDVIISTGANLYHDMHFALDMPLAQGNPDADDTVLHEQGIARIYDLYLTEETLLRTDEFVREVASSLPVDRSISTSRLHKELGDALAARGCPDGVSLLASAARHGVPVYTSSPGDSSIGMNLAALTLWDKGPVVDPSLDVLETTAIVYASARNGVVIVGGGSPKNFYLQTQPTLWQIVGIEKGGHDYDVQIGTEPPHWGGLSGATPSEAVSWGKVNPEELPNSVVVYCDATIALPMLAATALTEVGEREHRRLYERRDDLLADLRRDALAVLSDGKS